MISSILFSAYLEDVFCKLEWAKNEIKINRAYWNHLRFAADVLISQDPEVLQRHIQELHEVGEPFGLKISLKKSQVMLNKFTKERFFKISGSELDIVDHYLANGSQWKATQ